MLTKQDTVLLTTLGFVMFCENSMICFACTYSFKNSKVYLRMQSGFRITSFTFSWFLHIYFDMDLCHRFIEVFTKIVPHDSHFMFMF